MWRPYNRLSGEMANLRTARLISAALLIGSGVAQAQVPVHRGLLDTLVAGTHVGAGTGQPFELRAYPLEVRSALKAYMKRRAAYRTRRPRPRRNAEDDMVWQAWTAEERRLAAISSHPKAPAVARAYVDKLRPCYEWEGGSECPKREAVFAEAYLKAHPRSIFREYLPLLAAHRWVCTAEAYDNEQRTEDAARSRLACENSLRTAVRSRDSLIRTAAEELRKNPRCTPGVALP